MLTSEGNLALMLPSIGLGLGAQMNGYFLTDTVTAHHHVRECKTVSYEANSHGQLTHTGKRNISRILHITASCHISRVAQLYRQWASTIWNSARVTCHIACFNHSALSYGCVMPECTLRYLRFWPCMHLSFRGIPHCLSTGIMIAFVGNRSFHFYD